MTPTVGIDFDNTLVCYDALFHRCATELGLCDATVAPTRQTVRGAVLARHGNEAWTRLQGIVYGERILEAPPAPGAQAFLLRCKADGVRVCVVSHRTRQPAIGDPHDLHEAGRAWLAHHAFFSRFGLDPDLVFYETSQERKVARIATTGCTCFVDDLRACLLRPDFPARVLRVLYLPGDSERDEPVPPPLVPCRDWDHVTRVLFGDASARPSPPPASSASPPSSARLSPLLLARHLLARSADPSAASEGLHCEILAEGINSQVYRVRDRRAPDVVLKVYSPPAPGRPDRLATEYGALEFLWRQGVRCVPRPLAAGPDLHAAIYAFIPGRPLSEASPEAVRAAWEFFVALQDLRDPALTANVGAAAEACFTCDEHLAVLDRRFARLESALADASAADELYAAARDFCHHDLSSLRADVEANLLRGAKRLGIAPSCPLPTECRVLSPSDFGFHNMLAPAEGGDAFAFVDFEYFGWDDPAKTLADFLLQPRIVVAPGRHRELLDALAEAAVDERGTRPPWLVGALERLPLLYPLLGLKWCVIMLNAFCQPAPLLVSGRRACPPSPSQPLSAPEPAREAEASRRRTLRAQLGRAQSRATAVRQELAAVQRTGG